MYNEAAYVYRKDGQGNICALIDNSGNIVVEYKYDAWGNHAVLYWNKVNNKEQYSEVDEAAFDENYAKNKTIAELNPFRYRGYYYDTEIGLYYLKSRYYDPETGRFITIDDISYIDPETINGLNLYAYCGNNPVMRTDSQGTNWWTDFWNSLAGKIIGTILVVAAIVVVSVLTAGVGSAVAGALGGGLIASIVGGAVGGAVSGLIFGAGFSIINQGASNGYANIDWGQVGIDAAIGAASGAILGAAFAAGGRALSLLGKTKLAQRMLTNYSDKSINFLFGSVGKNETNLTLIRIGKKFRIEASSAYGLHYHLKTASTGLSVHRTKLINYIWNSIMGAVSYWARQ